MGLSRGQTEESTLVSGKTTSSMVMQFSPVQRGKCGGVGGRMGRGCTGMTARHCSLGSNNTGKYYPDKMVSFKPRVNDNIDFLEKEKKKIDDNFLFI